MRFYGLDLGYKAGDDDDLLDYYRKLDFLLKEQARYPELSS